MSRRAPALRAVLPIVALGLLAFVWGNFAGAAGARGAAASQALLVLGLAVGAAGWRRLPPGEAAALLALTAATALAAGLGEAPRAGRCAVVLVPACCILPRVVADLFPDAAALRSGLRALALLLALASGYALWGALFAGTPGAALPLGHHNLLAAFLLLLLPAPLALLAAPGAAGDRFLSVAAAGLGLAALIATRSLGGAIGLAVLAALYVPWRRLGRPALAAAAALALVAFLALGSRLVGAGEELGVSVAARAGYYEAGWRGFLAAPWLGHGPGSTPWLFALYFTPRVGVHPPDHLVGDLHSLPLQVLFELGLVGALAASCWLVTLLRPLFAATLPTDPFRAAAQRAARAGLLGALVFSGTGVLLAVPALPAAFGLLAGLGRAALGEAAAEREAGRSWPLGALVLALAAFWLAPGLLAQRQWDAARDSAGRDPALARAALERAVALDPGFPLYRARLASFAGDAEELDRAQREARAVPPLTLAAGLAAEAASRPEAAAILAEACDLDPFGGLAPWRLAVGQAGGADELRVDRAMRALVAEPRLVAAAAWRERPEVLRSALERLAADNRPAGWAEALAPSVRRVLAPEIGATADLVQTLDADPAEAVSLVFFRRLPAKTALARVPVVTEALPDLPPAVLEPDLRADFAAPSCRWRPASP